MLPPGPADRPRPRRALFLFLLLLLCYGYFLPRAGRSDWAASARADLVLAVADRGVLHIDDYHGNTGDKAFYGGHYYAVGSIGPSLLALPAYLAARPILNQVGSPGRRERAALLVMTLFAVSLPSALLGVCLYAFACRFTRERYAFVLALTYGIATIACPYSKARTAVLLAAVVAGFMLYVASYRYWSGGDAVGPRFLVPAVSFLVLPIACGLESWLSRPMGRLGFALLAVVSMLNVWAQSIAGQRYPPYEFRGAEVTNPTFQWAVPLLREGEVAENYGTVAGLEGLTSLLPLVAAVALLLWLALRPAPGDRAASA